MVYLERKRRRNLPFTPADLRAARGRLAASLAPALARCAFPYLKTPPRVDVGAGLALYNPLVHAGRQIEKALQDALESATLQRRSDELGVRERLQDLIVRERVVTAYQPILKLADRSVLGYEALSRGARGSGFETADLLFGAAEDHGLLLELDRLCRNRALLSTGRISSAARVFVNTLPATIRDPHFRGKALIDFLDRALVAPQRIVIEITEKLVIENYALFREAMAYFSDLGMSFAVDDVGAGYSGLEAIARLKPAFLKIDIALVRDVHVSRVNRAMVKAIVGLGAGIGATVIAEGIQADAEVVALREMGIEWGQGFLLARPEAPAE
jgi:EAL domain-containing protein (putative c-di-GMP-specific phosphodiesterase class I)